MSQEAPRPSQATIAGWLVIGGSIAVVASAWVRIAGLHTLEVQEELKQALSRPPLDSWGTTYQQLETVVRVGSMVAAAAATATAILGWYALRRSSSARLALTLLTPFLMIGGLATAAGFATPLVLFGILMLWLRPTRDWFAGRPWLPSTSAALHRRPDPFAPQAKPESEQVPAPERERTPPLVPSRAAAPGPFAEEYGAPLAATDPSPAPYGVVARRPRGLVAACTLVWASCAMAAGFMVLFSLVMAVARDWFFDEIERQQPDFDMRGMTQAELAAGAYAATAVIVLWCLAAAVLAVLAFRRISWAHPALVVCAGASGLALLAATFASPPLVVLLVADVVTVWLLLRPDVVAWFRREGPRSPAGPEPHR